MLASDEILVVSGLPRSGTSMVMAMLQAGGVPLVTDGIRAADEDNPRGYFEDERVRGLERGDRTWLSEARGRAIKVVSFLLPHLPSMLRSRVVFLERDLDEVMASQRRMLARRGTDGGDDAGLTEVFARHLVVTRALLDQRGWPVLRVPHRETVRDPAQTAVAIDAFLGGGLDVPAMTAVVDAGLYRQRKG